MLDAATASWTETTRTLIDELAKAREITPADTMTLMKFVSAVERHKREATTPVEKTGRLQVAS